MKKLQINLWLFTLLTGFASETKHIEMDYGNILSMSIESDAPTKENVTHKALVFRMVNQALPAKGTPIV